MLIKIGYDIALRLPFQSVGASLTATYPEILAIIYVLRVHPSRKAVAGRNS